MEESEMQRDATLSELAASTTTKIIALCAMQGTIPAAAQIDRFSQAFADQLRAIPPELWNAEYLAHVSRYLAPFIGPLLMQLASQTWQLESERAARVADEGTLQAASRRH